MAKKHSAKKEKEEGFFVGIHEPPELKKTILEASKDIVLALQKYEHLKNARAKKIHEIQHLKDILRELHRLMSKLRSSLPKTALRAEPVKAHKKPIKKSEPSVVSTPKRESTELDRLEDELKEIEGKLKGL